MFISDSPAVILAEPKSLLQPGRRDTDWENRLLRDEIQQLRAAIQVYQAIVARLSGQGGTPSSR
jgi:hypothetical protein